MPVVVIEGAVQNPDVPDAMIMDGLNPFPDCFYGQTAYRFSPPLTQKAQVLKQPRVVSSCTKGLLQLNSLLHSGGVSDWKFATRARPLS